MKEAEKERRRGCLIGEESALKALRHRLSKPQHGVIEYEKIRLCPTDILLLLSVETLVAWHRRRRRRGTRVERDASGALLHLKKRSLREWRGALVKGEWI